MRARSILVFSRVLKSAWGTFSVGDRFLLAPHFSFKRILITILLMMGSGVVGAFELGVGVHVGQGKNDPHSALTWIGKAGFTSFRDEIYWHDVERQAGVFAMEGKAATAESFFRSGGGLGYRPILILDYGNVNYDGGSQPYSSAGVAAFARYAGWISDRLKDVPLYYEVWNEWNYGAGTIPKVKRGDELAYVRLVEAASSAVRKSSSKAKIVVGAVADDLNGWPWMTKAMELGLLNHADAVSVHLYNYSAPVDRAGADEMVQRLMDLQKRVRAFSKGRHMPILVTETGWPTSLDGKGVVPVVASRELAKFLVAVRSVEDVEGVWIYELFDGGDNPYEKEHRFGMLHRDGLVKVAGCRLATLGPFLRKAELVQAVRGPRTVAYVLKTDGKFLVAAWRRREASAGGPMFVKAQFKGGTNRSLGGQCGDDIETSEVIRQDGDFVFDVGTKPSFFWVEGAATMGKIFEITN